MEISQPYLHCQEKGWVLCRIIAQATFFKDWSQLNKAEKDVTLLIIITHTAKAWWQSNNGITLNGITLLLDRYHHMPKHHMILPSYIKLHHNQYHFLWWQQRQFMQTQHRAPAYYRQRCTAGVDHAWWVCAVIVRSVFHAWYCWPYSPSLCNLNLSGCHRLRESTSHWSLPLPHRPPLVYLAHVA